MTWTILFLTVLVVVPWMLRSSILPFYIYAKPKMASSLSLFVTMALSPLIVLRAVFIVLGCVMVATLIYTISIDGLPFRKDLLTPWMKATLIDFYINVVALAVWVSYKETSWLTAVVWIAFLVILGSVTTCAYITLKLFELSNEESMQDLMRHLMLQKWNKNAAAQIRSSFQLVTARIVFTALGCLMLGTLIYTCASAGSPFNKENFTPWLNATLVDFYINVVALSVWVGYKESSWVGYKESSWVGKFAWIALLICLGSISTCAYIVRELLQLSPYDPLYLVLLNKKDRQVVSF